MNIWEDMDDQVPGGVYLCQINENVSCGACCGLYNVADPSRESLTRMLARRAALFETVPRGCDAIEDFGRQMAIEAGAGRLFPEFHHCPYTGLIGPNRSRVGCLLHPHADGNGGADFRGLSYYGGMACRRYFCPTYHRTPKPMKELIRCGAFDWYAYGLIITEADCLCAIFDRLRARGCDASGSFFRNDTGARLACALQLINLKLTWPFQPNSATDRVNYFFKDRLYEKPDIHYGETGADRSRYDDIFKNLVSVFHNEDQLRRAERMIDDLIDRLSRELLPT